MATLTVNGRKVKVDDGFLSLSPEQQEATVNEIAASLGSQSTQAPVALQGKVMPQGSTGEVSQNVEGLDARSSYNFALDRIRKTQFPQATDEQWAQIAKQYAPYDAMQLLQSGTTMGFADEVGGAGQALGALLAGRTQDLGAAYGDYSALEKARADLGREQQGVLGGAAEFAGSMLSGRPDQAFVSAAKTIPAKAIEAAKGSVLPGAIYGFGATDGDLHDRAGGALVGAGTGAAVGGAIGAAGGKVADMLTRGAQSKATAAAVKGAPAIDDLRSAATQMFTSSKASGTAFTPQKFTQFAADLVRKAKGKSIDPDLDGEALLIYRRMAELANKGRTTGQGVSLAELHNLRQKAQDVALSAPKDRTKGFAQDIVKGLDQLLENVKPADVIGGTQAANDLLEGISLWSRAKKMALIEEVITKAGYQKSGYENGLRLGFLGLLRNPQTRKLFSPAEIQEIERVGKGTVGANLLRLIGKFGFSQGGNGLGGFLGGTAGFTLGGPVGAAATTIGASLARTGAEKLTQRAAERAVKAVGAANLPTVKPLSLPPALAPGLLTGSLPLLPRIQ